MSTTWAMFVVLAPASAVSAVPVSVLPGSVLPASFSVPLSRLLVGRPPASSWPPASGLDVDPAGVPQAAAVVHARNAQALTDHEYDVAGTAS
jgi:hypothetical protein